MVEAVRPRPLQRLQTLRRRWVKATAKTAMAAVARLFQQQSLIGAQPVFDPSVFPWLAEFESHAPEILTELEAVLGGSERLPSFHEVSPDQARISQGRNWQVYPFYAFGDPFPPHCERCPKTAALLAGVPNLRNAMFSILAPRYHIPAHQGPTNGIIRIHLPLLVPRDWQSCRIRVGDRTFSWQPGQAVVFDDYYEHEVWNDTDETRVVLFFDVDRPMRPLGHLLNRLLIGIFKHSAYVKDAKRNMWREYAGRG
jgi:aspartyl/asparaginyl beta-hydroxylase (cupin superfamily)